jgi:hypothetical protein
MNIKVYKDKMYTTPRGAIHVVKIPISRKKYYRYIIFEMKRFIFDIGTLYIMQLVKNKKIIESWQLDKDTNEWKTRSNYEF